MTGDHESPMRLRNGPGQNEGQRLRVVAASRLHLAVDGRSLCGRLMVDELDVYRDEVGLLAWNDGPLERCAQCAAALVARSRRLAPMRAVAPEPAAARRR
jgi:hypothetical protein